jgi:hypothetical protein
MEWTVDKYGYDMIEGKECTIVISKRPSYCDRGNFLAHIEAHGKLALSLDRADLWPRYYFDLERAKLEIEAWLIKRGQVKGDSEDGENPFFGELSELEKAVDWVLNDAEEHKNYIWIQGSGAQNWVERLKKARGK